MRQRLPIIHTFINALAYSLAVFQLLRLVCHCYRYINIVKDHIFSEGCAKFLGSIKNWCMPSLEMRIIISYRYTQMRSEPGVQGVQRTGASISRGGKSIKKIISKCIYKWHVFVKIRLSTIVLQGLVVWVKIRRFNEIYLSQILFC